MLKGDQGVELRRLRVADKTRRAVSQKVRPEIDLDGEAAQRFQALREWRIATARA